MFGRNGSASSASPTLYASLLAGAYLVVAAAYIVVSGWIAAAVARDVEELEHIEHVKGIAFVLITGGLLWAVSWMMFARLQRANVDHARDRQALMLVQSKAYAAELAAAVAHDFNNLLLVVGFELDELVDHLGPDADPRTFAEMRRTLEAAKGLTERMAQAARGRREIRQDRLALGTLVSDTVHLVKRLPRVRGRNVQLEVKTSARALLDPVVVEQIVVNLLLNAADATEPRGVIRVMVDELESTVRLAVEDDGPGLDEQQIKEVLKPFHTTKPNGLGLGLLSVRSCAEASQGKLTVDRSPLGGARFTVAWGSAGSAPATGTRPKSPD